MLPIPPFLTFLLTALGTAGALWLSNWLLLGRQPGLSAERKLPRQLLMLGLTILGAVAVTLALPVDLGTRSQVIGFVSLIVSGIFAFSSSTVFANLMAGLMIRIMMPYRAGNFITVGELFGRVTEVGLLDTEVQTENRDLMAIPNLYLITRPITVVRSSGTIVSTRISLGYDVHHNRIESLLLSAIESCGLEEPFVHVVELGDFAITYKVGGLLTDPKYLLTQRSYLCKSILDVLHDHGIEIVSPGFMNQRALDPERQIIPSKRWEQQEAHKTVEQVVFDKAEKAERREGQKARLRQEIEAAQKALEESSAEEKPPLEASIEEARRLLDELESLSDELEALPQAPAETEVTKNPGPGETP